MERGRWLLSRKRSYPLNLLLPLRLAYSCSFARYPATICLFRAIFSSNICQGSA